MLKQLFFGAAVIFSSWGAQANDLWSPANNILQAPLFVADADGHNSEIYLTASDLARWCRDSDWKTEYSTRGKSEIYLTCTGKFPNSQKLAKQIFPLKLEDHDGPYPGVVLIGIFVGDAKLTKVNRMSAADQTAFLEHLQISRLSLQITGNPSRASGRKIETSPVSDPKWRPAEVVLDAPIQVELNEDEFNSPGLTLRQLASYCSRADGLPTFSPEVHFLTLNCWSQYDPGKVGSFSFIPGNANHKLAMKALSGFIAEQGVPASSFNLARFYDGISAAINASAD